MYVHSSALFAQADLHWRCLPDQYHTRYELHADHDGEPVVLATFTWDDGLRATVTSADGTWQFVHHGLFRQRVRAAPQHYAQDPTRPHQGRRTIARGWHGSWRLALPNGERVRWHVARGERWLCHGRGGKLLMSLQVAGNSYADLDADGRLDVFDGAYQLSEPLFVAELGWYLALDRRLMGVVASLVGGG